MDSARSCCPHTASHACSYHSRSNGTNFVDDAWDRTSAKGGTLSVSRLRSHHFSVDRRLWWNALHGRRNRLELVYRQRRNLVPWFDNLFRCPMEPLCLRQYCPVVPHIPAPSTTLDCYWECNRLCTSPHLV